METNDQREETRQTDEVRDEKNQEMTEKVAEGQQSGSANPAESPESETLKLQNEIAQQKDKYLRLYSEFENFRRRTAREKLEMVQSANEQLIKALLPVADDFERAEKSFKDRTEKEIEGFFLIQNKFRKTLDQFGVKPMAVEKGHDFDADIHEAITQIPAPDESLKGKVVDVVEKGYLINDKVIRFAKVVVGS